jgi:hypothetical protein
MDHLKHLGYSVTQHELDAASKQDFPGSQTLPRLLGDYGFQTRARLHNTVQIAPSASPMFWPELYAEIDSEV